ncbi:MAG TPA: helix-turn-helix domain-containing protein [Pseudonocardia sp.]|jgi:sigma-54 dependent transcriptional regulator, acetoin dehydrogenase operon transcriptional activator AcoR|nr:helix-turn-helix domain-containing protein [Pseudonocardia sp.]
MASVGVEREVARRAFLTGSHRGAGVAVRPAVLASWERSRHHGVDPDRITARFLGHRQDLGPVVNCAEDVFDAFRAENPESACSVVLVDAAGVVRARRDGDAGLGLLLDGVLLVPGYGWAELAVGTTALSIALHDDVEVALRGAEHYHSQLTFLSAAAARVVDARGEVLGVVGVLGHDADGTPLQLVLARALARQVADRVAGEPHRRSQLVLDLVRRRGHTGGWVLATDGDYVLTDAAARHLDGADLRVLSDLVLAGLALQDFTVRHVDLPSGTCAEVTTEPVRMSGELIGCVLAGGPAGAVRAPGPSEATRRQGSHVAPLTRRDYARDLRGPEEARREHAEARIRANRELLTPYLRARQEIAASIVQGRHHLLIGEPGVGKRTLVLDRFRATYPSGRVVVVDCGDVAADLVGSPADLDDRPHLLLLRGLNLLTPVAARRLDEALRPLVALPVPPLVIGCLDTPAVDATRPYGLLLRHFHEVTRVPPLRYRGDEVGEIAREVLRRMSTRRSLRLSLQVIRVLEGYAWPGNISELEDVLRYVVARKPLGEVQPPDLPALCFQGSARRMSILETAQCDAIIQALYESRGNRYKAAAMLGIARSSLYRKIDAFGISYIA